MGSEMIGQSLALVVSFASPELERVTTADLRMRIDGVTVWPALGEETVAVEIQIDDLLSYLTDFWKPLMLRQVYPLPIRSDRPSQFRAEAILRWAEQPSELAEAEDEVVTDFEEAHDVSRAFAGLFGLPAFWLMRSGDRFVCESAGRVWLLDYQSVRAALEATGDAIAAQLYGKADGRWSDLIDAWRIRDHGDPISLLSWSASLDGGVAGRLIEDNFLAAPADVPAAANDDDELRIAARMAGALPEAQIRQIISLARDLPKVDAHALDALAGAVRAHLHESFASQKPFVQGEAAASFVRQSSNYASVQFIDIFEFVRSLGADVRGVSTDPTTLDGLAVWGPNYGPGALINLASRRIANRGILERNTGARVTLAHELCHLLLDGEHAFTAVDVLGGRMPNDIERRAKAFAGELLLPGRVAADFWLAADQPTGVKGLTELLDRLGRKYGVTRTVAAWKLEHGLHRHGVDVKHVLDLVVPSR